MNLIPGTSADATAFRRSWTERLYLVTRRVIQATGTGLPR